MQKLMMTLQNLDNSKNIKKIFIKTFGCQMNEYDSNRIYDTVKKIGYIKTDKYEDANCYLLNTCHIRDKAKEKVYHEIGRVKKIFRFKNKPLVIVTGCVAQAEHEEMIKREPYIDFILGPQAYHKINDKILNHKIKKNNEDVIEFDAISKFKFLRKIKNQSKKISSFLTIQEGCDKFCHFCVVPYTRGPEYSRPFNQILDEAKCLVENGSREITLLGQNVNAYEYDGLRLSNIILELEKFPDLKRIRYTTSHPKDMTTDLINVYKISKKLMPLIHLPVQSGSDKILNLMNRKHTIKEYLNIINDFKKLNIKIRFSSDFIIAYPGENDSDFKDTLKIIEEVEFINSFSFVFSPRPGTVASKLPIINKEKSLKRLEIVQQKLFNNQKIMNKSIENKTINVLVENRTDDKSKLFGRSEYMTSVLFDGSDNLIGKIVEVQIKSSNQNTLFGEVVNQLNQKVV